MDGEQRIWQRGWYFSGITADPSNPDVVYVMDTVDLSFDRRREDVQRAARRSDRRRLSHALDRPDGFEPYDSRQRPGRGRHRQRREDLELLVQSADRAVLPRHHRQRVSVLGLRCAARFRRRHADRARSKYATISQQDFRPLDVGGENGISRPIRSIPASSTAIRAARAARPSPRGARDGRGAEPRPGS